ncbi:MAG: sugar transferase [Bacillota bacterium]
MLRTATRLRASIYIKYAVDKVVALIGLVFGLPILAAITIGSLVEDGPPVFFVQDRLGKDGQVFPMLKFRSMLVKSPVIRNPDGSTRVDREDPRVTRVGRFLRRTSLDEFPQLINVLLGQMSLVGPRPDLPEHMLQYSERDRLKLRMRPGLTGLAQVTGRNELQWSERTLLDNYYIDEFSLWLDMTILFRTVGAVIAGRGVQARR